EHEVADHGDTRRWLGEIRRQRQSEVGKAGGDALETFSQCRRQIGRRLQHRYGGQSNLKMSSLCGFCMPCSKDLSQIWAHGRPYMSGTSYSMTFGGATGVARPLMG